MSFRDAPLTRLGLALAGSLAFGAWAAEAQDASLPQAVIGAFETVVTDAKKAAAAAGQTMAPTRKAKRKRQSTAKDKDKPDGDSDAQDKNDKTDKTDGKSKRDDSANAEAKAPSGKDKSPAKEQPAAADPKAKAGAGGSGAKDAATQKKDAAPDAKDSKDASKDAQKPSEKKPSELTEWPAADIELAKARCTQLLKGLNIVAVPEAPFRKGACGTPAPVRVVSIGKNPEVTFQPPAVMTCDLAASLVKWIENDVQPAARKHLGSEVIRLESMSDYSCRMALGRVGNKLSEHGKANALDIGAFVTRNGKMASVLDNWGQNHRDVARAIAEAKAAKEAAEKAAREKAEVAAASATDAAAAKDAPIPRKTIVEGLPKPDKKTSSLELAASAKPSKNGLRLTPTGLGGPKAAESADADKGSGKRKKGKPGEKVAVLPGAEGEVAPPKPTNATSRFLHDIHDAACQIFGTTLGPEANPDHVNHFHVDMAERKYKKICD